MLRVGTWVWVAAGATLGSALLLVAAALDPSGEPWPAGLLAIPLATAAVAGACVGRLTRPGRIPVVPALAVATVPALFYTGGVGGPELALFVSIGAVAGAAPFACVIFPWRHSPLAAWAGALAAMVGLLWCFLASLPYLADLGRPREGTTSEGEGFLLTMLWVSFLVAAAGVSACAAALVGEGARQVGDIPASERDLRARRVLLRSLGISIVALSLAGILLSGALAMLAYQGDGCPSYRSCEEMWTRVSALGGIFPGFFVVWVAAGLAAVRATPVSAATARPPDPVEAARWRERLLRE